MFNREAVPYLTALGTGLPGQDIPTGLSVLAHIVVIVAIAGSAPHEGPGKSGGREGSEDGQIGLGMPNVGWHGDNPFGWGATDRVRQNIPHLSGSPSLFSDYIEFSRLAA
ncbi:hypothetical protein CBI36_07400 [Acetobacter oryzifermentans]|uniref:Uncharacterized protein n=2 Tax=Acetobacter TaxID=434 RepID=A0AAN1PHQ1_9PROT|nr:MULTISPECIES: hypothetical protein [Acetobacter]ASL40296.1 hypothetical protein CBI36_07400 [Acetobacter oryzifermentans]AXN00274.1 hypothetical protein CJF59_06815 [Acetobacter pomorum]